MGQRRHRWGPGLDRPRTGLEVERGVVRGAHDAGILDLALEESRLREKGRGWVGRTGSSPVLPVEFNKSLGANGGRRAAIKESLPASSGRNQRRFLTVSDDFRRPAAPSASLARQDEQARPRLPGAAPFPPVRDVLGLPELSAPPKQSTAADGGAWRGIIAFQKPLRSLRLQSMESARSRHAGPN